MARRRLLAELRAGIGLLLADRLDVWQTVQSSELPTVTSADVDCWPAYRGPDTHVMDFDRFQPSWPMPAPVATRALAEIAERVRRAVAVTMALAEQVDEALAQLPADDRSTAPLAYIATRLRPLFDQSDLDAWEPSVAQLIGVLRSLLTLVTDVADAGEHGPWRALADGMRHALAALAEVAPVDANNAALTDRPCATEPPGHLVATVPCRPTGPPVAAGSPCSGRAAVAAG